MATLSLYCTHVNYNITKLSKQAYVIHIESILYIAHQHVLKNFIGTQFVIQYEEGSIQGSHTIKKIAKQLTLASRSEPT